MTSRFYMPCRRFILDLHGMSVDVAMEKLERTLGGISALPGRCSIEVITGRGLHSLGQRPLIKHAVLQYLKDCARRVESCHGLSLVWVFVMSLSGWLTPYPQSVLCALPAAKNFGQLSQTLFGCKNTF